MQWMLPGFFVFVQMTNVVAYKIFFQILRLEDLFVVGQQVYIQFHNALRLVFRQASVFLFDGFQYASYLFNGKEGSESGQLIAEWRKKTTADGFSIHFFSKADVGKMESQDFARLAHQSVSFEV